MRQQLRGEGVLSNAGASVIFSSTTRSLSSISLPLLPWWMLTMGNSRDRFVWTVLLLLPVLGHSEALRDEWLPGNYPDTTAGAEQFLDAYNATAENVLFYSVSASWNYNTNITAANSQLQVRRLLGAKLIKLCEY